MGTVFNVMKLKMKSKWFLISLLVMMLFQFGTSRSIDYRRSPYVPKVEKGLMQIGIFHSNFVIDFCIVLLLTFGKKIHRIIGHVNEILI